MKHFQSLLQGCLEKARERQAYPLFHLKALNSLSACRTAKLGGHAQYCEDGHLNGIWYNSCKHRFCPQCQHINKERWIVNTQRILLNCPHHHVVFTLASELNVLWKYNRQLMSDLLFESVQDTLKVFSRDKRYLNAMPGMLFALHTWGRDMSFHPHLHVLVSHGGLNQQGQWVEPRKRHLFPQKPVMQVFRGKYLAKLTACVEASALQLPPDHCRGKVMNMLRRLYRKAWVVNFSERYDHARGVAKYLGRYIKGGPFRTGQVITLNDHQVKFQYQSHKTKRYEHLVMSQAAFVERLLQHVALPGKPTLRYGGLYVSSVREKLNTAREQLGQKTVTERLSLTWDVYLSDLGHLPVCSECGKLLTHKRALTRMS